MWAPRQQKICDDIIPPLLLTTSSESEKLMAARAEMILIPSEVGGAGGIVGWNRLLHPLMGAGLEVGGARGIVGHL